VHFHTEISVISCDTPSDNTKLANSVWGANFGGLQPPSPCLATSLHEQLTTLLTVSRWSQKVKNISSQIKLNVFCKHTLYNCRTFWHFNYLNRHVNIWCGESAMCVVKHLFSPTILLLYDVTRGSPDDEFQEFVYVWYNTAKNWCSYISRYTYWTDFHSLFIVWKRFTCRWWICTLLGPLYGAIAVPLSRVVVNIVVVVDIDEQAACDSSDTWWMAM